MTYFGSLLSLPFCSCVAEILGILKTFTTEMEYVNAISGYEGFGIHRCSSRNALWFGDTVANPNFNYVPQRNQDGVTEMEGCRCLWKDYLIRIQGKHHFLRKNNAKVNNMFTEKGISSTYFKWKWKFTVKYMFSFLY